LNHNSIADWLYFLFLAIRYANPGVVSSIISAVLADPNSGACTIVVDVELVVVVVGCEHGGFLVVVVVPSVVVGLVVVVQCECVVVVVGLLVVVVALVVVVVVGWLQPHM
jgi:hypothetical protein